MTISVVLRLAGSALDEGRLAGEAELVTTGERVVVRDAGELMRFLREASAVRAALPQADENEGRATGG